MRWVTANRYRKFNSSHRRYSLKKGFLKKFSKIQRKTSVPDFLFCITCNFIKKEILAEMPYCEFCQIFDNTFFYRTFPGNRFRKLELSNSFLRFHASFETPESFNVFTTKQITYSTYVCKAKWVYLKQYIFLSFPFNYLAF